MFEEPKSKSGLRKCGGGLAPRDQKLGVRERLFYLLYFIMHLNAVR